MKFIEWRDANEFGDCSAKAAWDYQQFSIDGLLEDRAVDRARINELERWIAAIADDHPQIPNWIQQSARSLLSQSSNDQAK